MVTNNTDTFIKTEVFVNEIVFYRHDEISLLGFVHDGGKFYETEFVISRNTLQTLLNGNKKAGAEIQWRIEQLFAEAHQSPAYINLVELFGTTQVLDAQEIVLEIPAFRKLGAANERKTLFVNSVIPAAIKTRKAINNI